MEEVHFSNVVGLAAFCGCREWVHFSNVDGLLVIGGGTFDARGATAWPLNECPRKRGWGGGGGAVGDRDRRR
jgi:galacturan 1,4-alpha-galacturonidase